MDRVILMTAAALLLGACCNEKTGINPTAELLRQTVENGQYMYGHQDDLMYGHTWSATKEDDHSLERSDVLSTAGAYPYVLGLDLGGVELDADSPYGKGTNLDGNNLALQLEAARKHYERGGVVTFSWHPRNPVTGGDAWDVSDRKVVEKILPGGECHEYFMGWLAKIGDYLAQVSDIPAIFRPWHEHTGSWFWWGAGLCTPEQYNGLWVMTYDYLVKERGLTNLVWAISPNGMDYNFEAWEERYPGDDYVDIIGLDLYQFKAEGESLESSNARYIKSMKNNLASLEKMASEHGKILAVTETGFESLPYENWWTEVLMPAVEGFPIAYVLTWRNTDEPGRCDIHYYAPYPGGRSEADFQAFEKDTKTLFLQ